MSVYAVNLVVRFFLEVAALISFGSWGWHQGSGVLSYVLAFGIPLLAATLWGVFAVQHDPGRSGKAPIPIQGSFVLLLSLLSLPLQHGPYLI